MNIYQTNRKRKYAFLFVVKFNLLDYEPFFPLKQKYNFSWKRIVVWGFLESAGNLKQPHSANIFSLDQ